MRASSLAEILMAARSSSGAAVRALTDRAVTCIALRLYALAAQVLVRSCKIALPVIVKVLLLATKAVCALLAIVSSLGSINAGFLTGGWVNPLRRNFLWNYQCYCKQQADKDIF